MALVSPITDLEQLKAHPALGRLLDSMGSAVQSAKFDRDELTIWMDKAFIREACAILRDDRECPFNYLSDVTCVDWYPSEPRFEVVYHLLSIPKKERVRLKARLDGSSPAIESVTSVWPSANFYEREVFDLFGVRFTGHPNLNLASTSYVERLNGTTRLHVRRLTRLTYAFSKKLENFQAAVALHFAYYNFVKRHNTLRMTPAMAAGIERDFWSVGNLIKAAP